MGPESFSPLAGLRSANVPVRFIIYISGGKGEGKAILVQAWTGPEGFRRLGLPDFDTIGT